MTFRIIAVLVALLLVIAIPFALKPKENLLAKADDTLVIITPHSEAIRHEFTYAFTRYYKEKTGRTVRLDWRMPGGTSEIARYLKGEYFAAFENRWKKSGGSWTPEVQGAFDNPRVELPADPAEDTPAQAARRAFLASDVGIGIDLFFGGGSFDFAAQAVAGRLVDSGVLTRRAEWFGSTGSIGSIGSLGRSPKINSVGQRPTNAIPQIHKPCKGDIDDVRISPLQGSDDFPSNEGRYPSLLMEGLRPSGSPEFNDTVIPQSVSGEEFYDKQGRWIGVVLSSFGICYNTDVLNKWKVESGKWKVGTAAPTAHDPAEGGNNNFQLSTFNFQLPTQWADLASPYFFKNVALADPTKSGSAAKAYEMIIQQQMQLKLAAGGERGDDLPEAEALAQGWIAGLQIIQRVAANARYFTDSASIVPVDVSLGNAAIGMCIDFYGYRQAEAVKFGDEPSRLVFVTPRGGSAVSVDPIGLLRGAPNREIAEMFIDFTLSPEGQKIWNYKVGAPGGPVRYALRRLPIRKDFYVPETLEFRTDPDINPYEDAKDFFYHAAWTSPLFKTIAFTIRVAFLDTHDELVSAWKALIAADFPPEAMAKFSDLSAVDFQTAKEVIRPALSHADRLREVQLAKELSAHFRRQYREAEKLARGAP